MSDYHIGIYYVFFCCLNIFDIITLSWLRPNHYVLLSWLHYYYMIRGPFYWHGLTLIPTWINNHRHNKMWDESTYPFPNLNGYTVEVWEWRISSHNLLNGCNYVSMVGLNLNHFSKRSHCCGGLCSVRPTSYHVLASRTSSHFEAATYLTTSWIFVSHAVLHKSGISSLLGCMELHTVSLNFAYSPWQGMSVSYLTRASWVFEIIWINLSWPEAWNHKLWYQGLW